MAASKDPYLYDKCCGSNCSNQLLLNGFEGKGLQFESDDEFGTSITTTGYNKSGSEVVEFVGKVESAVVNENQRFAYQISREGIEILLIINCNKQGNEARQIAHNIRPNCVVETWIVQRQVRLLVVASNDIKPGQVLTLCYPQMAKSDPISDVDAEYYFKFYKKFLGKSN